MEFVTKRCKDCETRKPVAEYYRSPKGIYSPYCNICKKVRERKPEHRWQMMRTKARTRNGEWLLTIEEFKSFLAEPCFYCQGKLGETGSSLDRLNSKADYMIGNVVPSCAICNWVRHDIFTHEEMKELGMVVKKIRADRLARGDLTLTMPIQRIIKRKPRNDIGKKRKPFSELKT